MQIRIPVPDPGNGTVDREKKIWQKLNFFFQLQIAINELMKNSYLLSPQEIIWNRLKKKKKNAEFFADFNTAGSRSGTR